MFQNLIPLNAEVTFFSSPFKNKQMTRHIGYIRAVLRWIFSTFSLCVSILRRTDRHTVCNQILSRWQKLIYVKVQNVFDMLGFML